MSAGERSSPSRRTPHPLVEVVGVAGTGKTTLLDAVCERAPTVRRAEPFHMRHPSHLAAAVRAPATLWPLLVRRLAQAPRPSWPDVKLMLYVSGWRRFLARSERAAPTVFDQGPIYALVRLKARAAPVTRSAAFGRWWDDALAAWARELDIVVWLDAPDDMLLRRIGTRARAHALKDHPVADGHRFVARYRELFEEALDRIDTAGHPTIVRVDTGAMPVDAAATALGSLIAAHELAGPAPAGRQVVAPVGAPGGAGGRDG